MAVSPVSITTRPDQALAAGSAAGSDVVGQAGERAGERTMQDAAGETGCGCGGCVCGAEA